MRTFAVRAFSLMILPGTLACCTRTDPYLRPGEWHPLGANAENLRAMVADRNDLYAGRGSTVSPGDEAAAAVLRLRLDQVKPLPASSLSDVKVNDTPTAQQGAGGASAAAPVAGAAAAATSGP